MIRRWHLSTICVLGLSVFGSGIAGAQSGDGADDRQMLVIPLSGTDKLGDAKLPRALDRALSRAAKKSGAMLINARVSDKDIAAIVGCKSASSDCYDSVATTIGVQEIVFGSARKEGENIAVEVTWVRVGKPVKRIEVQVGPVGSAAELETKLEPFFAPPKPEPVKPVPEPLPPAPKKEPGFSLSRVRGSSWAVLGAGVGAMGIGALFLSLASKRQGEIDEAPTDSLADLQRLEALENGGRRYNLLGTSSLLAGTALAVLGGVLVWRQASRVPAEKKPVATVSPVLTPGGAGITVRLSLDL